MERTRYSIQPIKARFFVSNPTFMIVNFNFRQIAVDAQAVLPRSAMAKIKYEDRYKISLF